MEHPGPVLPLLETKPIGTIAPDQGTTIIEGQIKPFLIRDHLIGGKVAVAAGLMSILKHPTPHLIADAPDHP